MTRLRPVQVAALAGAAVVGLWSIAGLIVHPDFATGAAATSETVLGVDMNGWHAVSGFLVAVPLVVLIRRIEPLRLLVALSALSLVATGVWALLDARPAGGLFAFPHQTTDALLHFATASIFAVGLVADRHERVAIA